LLHMQVALGSRPRPESTPLHWWQVSCEMLLNHVRVSHP